MKLYCEGKNHKLYHGNMLDMLEVIEKESIDSIVTDPPYGLTSITKRFGKENSAPAQFGKDGAFRRLSRGFMGKEWDGSGIEYNIETWRKCYEVLKEGGYLLAFGGSRTFHRIACAIEDAGFEIRDTIMWLYGSGFPKSTNLGLTIDKKNGVESKVIGKQIVPDIRGDAYGTMNEKQGGAYKNITRDIKKAQNEWEGWGTCLKPSFEPIIVARKPFKGSLVDNIIKNGVGGINIDECRIDFVNEQDYKKTANKNKHKDFNSKPILNNNVYGDYSMLKPKNYCSSGRFPANTILTYDKYDYEEVCSGFPYTKNSKRNSKNNKDTNYTNTYTPNKAIYTDNNTYGDEGSASRYFYCAKASKKDRDEGLENFKEKVGHNKGNELDRICEFCGVSQLTPELCHCEVKSWVAKPRKNTHPTVKPTELMQYLVRLVTPSNGTVLDPFNGSGSTGKAVMYENLERNKDYKYIGIDITEDYLPISKARIEYVNNLKIESKVDKQMSIYDIK